MKAQFQKTVYPAGLLVAGRPCLVVGGGRAAGRKAAGLLEAGAVVTVVSSALDAGLEALVAAGRVRHLPRPFREADLDGMVLVFASAGTKDVNRRVLAACRARGVLCCCADGNWHQSDFVTPAVLRKGPLTVAVSTGGKNCRRSRLIKQNLERHLALSESVECMVTGISHQEATLAEREGVHLSGRRLEATGQMLTQVRGLHEFMLLSTCNRTELLAVKTRGTESTDLLRRILGFDRLPRRLVYNRRGFRAFEHSALLAAGLLSQSPGEYHIVAQIKAALADATERGWAGGVLTEWMAAALHISKHIRRNRTDAIPSEEIEDAAIRYLATQGAGGGAAVVVVGTGVIGAGMVQRLATAGRPCTWVFHRRRPAAVTVPAGVRLRPWRELFDALGSADAVIVATGARTPVLGPAQARALGTERPVLLLDLSTPRNIDPALAGILPEARLIDLDRLREAARFASTHLEALVHDGRDVVQANRVRYTALMQGFRYQGGGDDGI